MQTIMDEFRVYKIKIQTSCRILVNKYRPNGLGDKY